MPSLPLADAAAHMRVSVDTLRRRIRRGELEAVKDDRGRYLVKVADTRRRQASTRHLATSPRWPYGWSPDRIMDLMDPYDHDAEASATIEAFFDRNPELAVDRLYPDNDPGAEGAVDNLVLWYRDTLGELAKP